jgi:hypothetical protein
MFNIEEINEAARKESERRDFIIDLFERVSEGHEVTEDEKNKLLEYKKEEEEKIGGKKGC